MKKKLFVYDWKTFQLVTFAWCPWFFGAILITLFYYALVFTLSNLLFNGMNFYLQGVLAGLTGGVWGYGINKAYKKQEKIENNIKKFTEQQYNIILRKAFYQAIFFIFLVIIEILIIVLLKLY